MGLRSMSFVGNRIEEESFKIIQKEAGKRAKKFKNLEWQIIRRIIHTTADFEFIDSTVFHPDAVRAGIEAIKGGKDILTDVEMVRSGINKKLLGKWGGRVICNIQQSAFSHQQSEVKTKAEMGIELALMENNNIGIIAIGNAPTALLKTIEILANSELRTPNFSPLVIGVPVGFVKAYESKTLLAEQKFPFITNLSRKGGSPVAAATINALLKIAYLEETK